MRSVWLIGLGWLILGALGSPLESQVSPGPLARAHRELEGTLKCTKCHGSGKDAIQARCLACHRDVDWLAHRNLGLHGTPEARGQRCASCHPDHAGAGFQLIKWPDGSAERFDHRRTNWPLRQSHARQQCAACHKPEFRTSPAAPLAPGGRSRWTGLEQRCESCHQDVHRGALGAACADCHDAGTWRSTPGFRHDTTGYPLTGRHLAATCDDCHAGPGRAAPVYRPIAHQSCAACHRDVHDGRFGGNCASCHSTQGFRQITPSGFDHSRTRYPLKGRHSVIRCSGCHPDFSTERGRRPAAATCAACHRDPHGGTGTVQGKPADCAGCHAETGFRPAVFPLERHQASRFPLEGKHQKVPCAACHRKDPAAGGKWGTAGVVLLPAFGGCSACHADDHGGQLSNRPGTGECAECHTASGWQPSRFGAEAHGKLRLPLEGRHAAIECRACHGPGRKGLRLPAASGSLGRARFAFGAVETECAACHLDPHGGRFPRCQACHGTAGFVPTTVDEAAHRGFRFPLNGAHRATPCAACHREIGRPAAPQRFEAKLGCADCHQSVHGSQFETRKDRGRCEACHTEDAFAPAGKFDHDRDAALPLKGGHQHVACTGCHRAEPGLNGTTRAIYRPVASKCEACHRK